MKKNTPFDPNNAQFKRQTYSALTQTEMQKLANDINLSYQAADMFIKKQISLEEREQLNIIAQEAREKLIVNNIRFVVKIAKKYLTTSDVALSDLVNEGTLGLIKAVENYKPQQGKFTTYASWWIRRTINTFVQNNSRTIKLPSGIYERLNLFKREKDKLQIKLGREPTIKELAQFLNMSVKRIKDLQRINELNLKINESDTNPDSTPTSYSPDLLPDKKVPNPLELLLKTEKITVEQAFNVLTEEEKDIVSQYYGLFGKTPKTLKEIEKNANHKISKTTVKNIINKSLAKMKIHFITPNNDEINHYSI